MNEEREQAAFHIHRAIELLIRHQLKNSTDDDLEPSSELTAAEIALAMAAIDVDLREILLEEYLLAYAPRTFKANIGGRNRDNTDETTNRIMAHMARQLSDDLARAPEFRKAAYLKEWKEHCAKWNTMLLADNAYAIYIDRPPFKKPNNTQLADFMIELKDDDRKFHTLPNHNAIKNYIKGREFPFHRLSQRIREVKPFIHSSNYSLLLAML